MFLVYEGLDGGGKTTLIEELKKRIEKETDREVIVTSEPGGTRVAECIREMLKHPVRLYGEPLRERTRIALFNAARLQNYYNVILPALESGKIVLCDRFNWSTYVYTTPALRQLARRLHKEFFGEAVRPTQTFLLDVTYEESLRRRGVGEIDEIETKLYDRYQECRDYYHKLVKSEGYAQILDASRPTSELADHVLDFIMARLEDESI